MPRPKGSTTYDNYGRVVLVTGGCNGIGRAIAEKFANSGAQVVVADIDPEAAQSLTPQIAFIQADSAKEDDCSAAIQMSVERFGGLDVLVNNAAIQPRSSYVRLTELVAAEMERITAVNFYGYAFMAKHAIQVMLGQGSGVVVNLSSGQGHRTARKVPVYGPIKAATILQTMQWGVEFAREGIRVVSVSPGAIDTPLVRASLAEQGGAAALANRHPLGRIGQPDEIANAVMWLASDDASFVTATDLQVDGGLGAFGAFADPY